MGKFFLTNWIGTLTRETVRAVKNTINFVGDEIIGRSVDWVADEVIGRGVENITEHAVDGGLNELGGWLNNRGFGEEATRRIIDTVMKFGDTIKPEDVQGAIINFEHLLPKVEGAIPVFTQTAQTIQRAVTPIAVGAVMAGVGAMTTAAATITIAILAGFQLREQKKTNRILDEHTAIMKNMAVLLQQQLEEHKEGNKKLEAIYSELQALNYRFSVQQEIRRREEEKLLSLFNNERYSEGVVYYGSVASSIDYKVHMYGSLHLCKTAQNFAAIGSLSRAIHLNEEKNSSYFLYRGLVYMQLGWNQRAQEDFKKVLEKRPNFKIAKTLLFLAQQNNGPLDENCAIPDLDPISLFQLHRNETAAGCTFRNTASLAMFAMLNESLADLQKIKEKKPASKKTAILIEEVSYWLAIFYSRQGFADKAICEFEKLSPIQL